MRSDISILKHKAFHCIISFTYTGTYLHVRLSRASLLFSYLCYLPTFSKERRPQLTRLSNGVWLVREYETENNEYEENSSAHMATSLMNIEKDVFGFFSLCMVNKSKDLTERKVKIDFSHKKIPNIKMAHLLPGNLKSFLLKKNS